MNAKRRRARRRRRTVGVGAVILAVWAAIAFRGNPVDQVDAPDAEATPAAHPEPAPAPKPAPDREAQPAPTPEPEPEPEHERAPRHEPDPAPEPRPDPALIDRLGGGLYTVDQAIGEGRLGAACAAWDEVAALELSAFAELTARRGAAATRLDGALAARMRTVAEMVRTGRVLDAHDALRTARTPRHERIEQALASLATEGAWPAWPPRPAGGEETPVPERLRPDRLVRVCIEDEWQLGRVTRSVNRPGLGEELTLRIDAASGPAFRFVRRRDVEPVATTTTEAVDQAAAALRAGEPLLCALWLAYRAGRDQGDDARAREVASAVGGDGANGDREAVKAAAPPTRAIPR